MRDLNVSNLKSDLFLSEIMSKIKKPLNEIVRLNNLLQKSDSSTNITVKNTSEFVLKNSEQINTIIESILQIERENEIEIILHNKLKFPTIYKVKTAFSTSSDFGNQLSEEKKIATQHDINWLIKLERTIVEYIADENISSEFLAKILLVSERQMYRKIQKFTSLTPNKYIRLIKLYQAKELLEKRKCSSLNEIANAVGYKDPHYFSNLFSQHFGKAPLHYIK